MSRSDAAHTRAVNRVLEDNPRWSGETGLIAKNVGLKKLLFEAVNFIEADLEGLREGISVNGRLSGMAEDADTLKEIHSLELWLMYVQIELGRG